MKINEVKFVIIIDFCELILLEWLEVSPLVKSAESKIPLAATTITATSTKLMDKPGQYRTLHLPQPFH